MNKSVLVTGSAGFIGSNFVRVFKETYPKVSVIGLDVKKSSGLEDFFYKVSITDKKSLVKIFKKHKPEYVFHFGAIPRVSYSVLHPGETSRVNIYGTILLLETARDFNVKRFIFSSSSSVYGGAKKLPTKESENMPNPQSPYATQKYTGEIFCSHMSKLHNLDTVSLRYFNVYGPGQYGDSPYSTVMSAWLEALYFGKKPFIEGNGKQSRDFTYVDDVVSANIKVMNFKGKFNGEIFNIGAGSRNSLLDVKKIIEEYTGKKLSLEKRPPRIGDVLHTQADISKAKRVFGYKPSVPIEEGLKKTIQWFDSRIKGSKSSKSKLKK